MEEYYYDGKYTFTEFETEFWKFMDADEIDEDQYNRNRKLFDSIVEKMFRMYIQSNVDHNFMFHLASRIIESYNQYSNVDL